MINKITHKEEPTLFNDIDELSIESIKQHRKGSTFFREDIIEISLEDEIYYLEVKNFKQYLGTWRTDNLIWDSNHGFDEQSFSELTRVEKKEKISYEWVDVN